MAYTLLDAAYEMYYPEAEFSKAGMLRKAGRKARVAAGRAGQMAGRAGRGAGYLARRAGGVAMKNKGKVALGVGGALALGGLGKLAASRKAARPKQPISMPANRLLPPVNPGSYPRYPQRG